MDFLEALERLDREGYVVVPGALDAPTVARLRRAFEGAPAQKDGTQHVVLAPDAPERDAWIALREHPLLVAAARRVLGDAFTAGEPHGRNPLPGYGEQGLHADWMPRARGEGFVVLTSIWMLDAFTAENGATRVVPGTHRIARTPPKSLAQPGASQAGERVAAGAAGSVLLLNGHTWHAGRRNASGEPRRAVQLVVKRAGAASFNPSS